MVLMEEEQDKLTRIAILLNNGQWVTMAVIYVYHVMISRQECKKSCPVVRMGKLCIEVTPSDK